MVKNHVHFIKLGGTIEFFDPAYEEINRKLMKLDTTIDSYLRNLIQPHFSFSAESLVAKDSREVTVEDRARLIKVIATSPHKNIIVTHGTYTMWQTAEYLEKAFSETKKLGDKKIILTGSMIPIAGFSISDAGFNLGFTIASFSSAKPGVYMSMNGDTFHVGELHKNESLLRFE